MDKKFLASAATSLTLAASSIILYSEKTIKVTEYTLNTGKCKNDITVTVLSDMHFKRFGKDNIRLIERVKSTAPDIICLAGDFFDKKNDRNSRDTAVATINGLSKIAPVYFAPGNHDIRFTAGTGEDYRALAEAAGCTVLNGEYVDLTIKGEKIRIGGVFDHDIYPEDYLGRWQDSPVYKYLSDFQDTDAVKLVMMHRPNTLMYTEPIWNIDGVFSGHNHGGLWQIPFIGGVFAPEEGFFPKYDKGEFDFGKIKMFLCAGLEGYWIVPRLFNPPEIMKITVK